VSGDTAAFVELVKRYDRVLRALAYRLLGERELMDDVMQEASVKAFRAYPEFRGESQVHTWLYRIVYNACLDQLRQEKRRRAVGEMDPGDVVKGGAEATVGGDPAELVGARQDLASALASLPADHCAAVLLVDAIGLTHGEAAEVLGVRAGTTGSRLFHARAALRRALGEGRDHGE